MRKQLQSAPTVLPRQSQPNPYSPVLDYHVCSTHHLRIMEIRQDWTHTHTTHKDTNAKLVGHLPVVLKRVITPVVSPDKSTWGRFPLICPEWKQHGNSLMQICFVWCSGTRCHSDCDTYFSLNVTLRPMISCVYAFEWLERVDEWEEKKKKILWMCIKHVHLCVCVCECFSVRVRVLMVLNGPM